MKRHVFFLLAILPFFYLDANAGSEETDWAVVSGRSECAFLNIPPPVYEGITWTGECADGYIHGQGVLTYVNEQHSTTLSGAFSKGELSGIGELVYWYFKKGSYNKITYQGAFVHSRMNGPGVLNLSHLGVIKGEFKNGFLNGSGTYTQPGKFKISGYFRGAPPSFGIIGKGVLEILGQNAYRYEGSFNGVVKEGDGILILANGTKYEGSFHNDQYHGYGILSYADGDQCEGQWENGRLIGVGKGVQNGQNTHCAMRQDGSLFFEPLK